MNYEILIRVAADSIESLRKCDVERVLEECPQPARKGLGEYIANNRPEFECEVNEVLEFLNT